MPTRPPSVCPTCGTPTSGPCPSCRARTDRARGTPAQRGYDSAWENLRAWHLRDHPWCTSCGVLPDHPEVDHIVPIDEAPERRLDPTNLRTLCKPCHSRRTRHHAQQRRL